MEYGLVVFNHTDNLGDDIQSYAAMQFLPKVDYLIDREAMDVFCPQSKDYVAVILNGWYMHDKYSWPPSAYLVPLCLSMHFTRYDHLGIGEKYLEGLGAEYLRRHGSVGCRDDATLQLMQQKDIDAWFSGCLTLTLPARAKSTPKQPYLCICDLTEEQTARAEELAERAGLSVVKTTHTVDYFKQQKNWTQRQEAVEAVLDTYQNAVCVITSRLHCALPCLAMQVPVLLLYDEEHSDTLRLGTYAKMTNHMSGEDFVSGAGQYDVLNPPPNPTGYLAIREDLTARCRAFVEKTAQPDFCAVLPKQEFEEGWLKRVLWQKQLLAQSVDDYRSRENEYRTYIAQLQEGNRWVEEHYNGALKQLDEMHKWAKTQDETIEWLKKELEQAKNFAATVQEEQKKNLTEIQENLRQTEEAKKQLEEKLVQKNNHIQQLERVWSHPIHFLGRKALQQVHKFTGGKKS